MSGPQFAGVTVHPSRDATTAVLITQSRAGFWIIGKANLSALPARCVVGVDSFDGTSIFAALHELGHAAALLTPSMGQRARVARHWSDFKFIANDQMTRALYEALSFTKDASQRFRGLSPLAAATFFALAVAAASSGSVSLRSGVSRPQDRQPSAKSLDHAQRFFGLKIPMSSRFQFLFGVADRGGQTVGRESAHDLGQIAQQRDGGDFLGGQLAGEQVSEHQGVSKVAGCGTATGARVAGRSEQAAGDDRIEA